MEKRRHVNRMWIKSTCCTVFCKDTDFKWDDCQCNTPYILTSHSICKPLRTYGYQRVPTYGWSIIYGSSIMRNEDTSRSEEPYTDLGKGTAPHLGCWPSREESIELQYCPRRTNVPVRFVHQVLNPSVPCLWCVSTLPFWQRGKVLSTRVDLFSRLGLLIGIRTLLTPSSWVFYNIAFKKD